MMTIKLTYPYGLIGLLQRLFFASAKNDAVTEDHRIQLFDRILHENNNLISRICFGFAATKEEFEDLRQDAFATIWEALPRFRGESQLATWLYRVTLNTCVATIRKKQPETRHFTVDDIRDVVDHSTDEASMLAEIHDAIAELRNIDKAIVLLWLEGVCYEEISDLTGLPRNTVATRLRRAKEQLKTKLQ